MKTLIDPDGNEYQIHDSCEGMVLLEIINQHKQVVSSTYVPDDIITALEQSFKYDP